MTDMQPQNPQQGPLPAVPPGMQPVPPEPLVPAPERAEVLQALLRACRDCAVLASGAPDSREVSEAGRAALAFAQAAVILDPELVAPQGVPADALFPPKPQIPIDRSKS